MPYPARSRRTADANDEATNARCQAPGTRHQAPATPAGPSLHGIRESIRDGNGDGETNQPVVPLATVDSADFYALHGGV